MSDPLAIVGDFADLKTVKSRATVQMILEFPIEHGERIVRMFGFPQSANPVQLAVARLAATPQIEAKANGDGREHGPWHTLTPTLQAVLRCKQERFWAFLRQRGEAHVLNEDAAATYVRLACGINTRSTLSTNNAAARKWGTLDGEYIGWLTETQVVG